MSKAYQKKQSDAPDALELTVPEHVRVAIAEVAADMREACSLSRSVPGCRS